MQYLLFFGTFLGILFGAHAIIYFSLVHFFGVGTDIKRVFLIVLGFLSVSFILASVLAHWYDNVATRWFYFLSASWLGVLSNACFLFLFAWLVIWLLHIFGIALSPVMVWSVASILVILVSGYGLYNANNPVVRKETVYIHNLPEAWEGKKIVQVTDVHLGHIIREEFSTRLTDQINAQDPALVAIVGDLFDGMDGHLAWLVRPLESIQSTYGTYVITGNHETYLGTGKVYDMLKDTPLQIIDDTLLNLNGLQLIGVGWGGDRGGHRDLKTIFAHLGYDRTLPSVFLYHAPTEIDVAKSLGVSLQLTGHTHRGQLYPYNLITRAIFKGYDYGLYREGGYTLSASSGVGTWWPPMRTNAHPEIVVLTLRKIQGK